MFKWLERSTRGKPVYRVDFIATGYMSNKYIAHTVTVAGEDVVKVLARTLPQEMINKLAALECALVKEHIGYERDYLITDYVHYQLNGEWE